MSDYRNKYCTNCHMRAVECKCSNIEYWLDVCPVCKLNGLECDCDSFKAISRQAKSIYNDETEVVRVESIKPYKDEIEILKGVINGLHVMDKVWIEKVKTLKLKNKKLRIKNKNLVAKVEPIAHLETKIRILTDCKHQLQSNNSIMSTMLNEKQSRIDNINAEIKVNRRIAAQQLNKVKTDNENLESLIRALRKTIDNQGRGLDSRDKLISRLNAQLKALDSLKHNNK